MQFHSRSMKVIALLVVLLAVAVTSQANSIPVRGSSHYGANANSSFNACEGGTFGNPCEAFNLTKPTVVTFNGLSYDVYQFTFGNGTKAGKVFDVIDIGSIAANTTFTLPSIFTPALTEVFSCNDNATPTSGASQYVFDSGNNPMSGPCTPGLSAAPAISESGGSFTTGSGFNVYNLVLDVPVADSPTPEPSSFLLFGTSLLGLAPFRRKLFGR